MKILLLMPNKYGIAQSLANILSLRGSECLDLDFRDYIKKWQLASNVQMFRFPDKVRILWESYYYTAINRWYKRQFSAHHPDLVFVYNNEMLLPDTLSWLKEKKVKVAFYLGDNPLYTLTSRHNLTVLEYADAVFVPDTFWQEQLKKIGLPSVFHLLLPLAEDLYFPVTNLGAIDHEQYKTEILYVGMSYNNSWGYKKARFLSYFSDYDLQIHGNKAWKRWFKHFPALRSHFVENKGLIPVERLNKMYNCTKIIPVDGNPGILHGIHLRAIEALSAGALPLMEWNADMDFIFEGITDLPAVKDYGIIPEMLGYYLNNDGKRRELVDRMTNSYRRRYSTEMVFNFIMEKLGI